MANVFAAKKSDGLCQLPVASATVIEAGDLLYYDSGNNDVRPFSSLSDNGDEESNQAEAARLFVGVAVHASADGDTTNVVLHCDTVTEFEFTVPSATYAASSLLGASENSGGDGLEDQQLEAVTSKDAAIFVVTREYTSAVTTVRCRMLRSVIAAPDLPARADTNTETLTGAKVLTHDDAKYQFLDPGGSARNVDLPPEEESAGLSFVIANTADAAEVITVRDDAAATIATPTQNETALVFCDGTSWVGIVGSA